MCNLSQATYALALSIQLGDTDVYDRRQKHEERLAAEKQQQDEEETQKNEEVRKRYQSGTNSQARVQISVAHA